LGCKYAIKGSNHAQFEGLELLIHWLED
jgi:hypothetical protein